MPGPDSRVRSGTDAGIHAVTADRYRRFAAEADGRCRLYVDLAGAVADDDALLAFLAAQPEERRQPNLFLAAVRWVAGVPADGAALRQAVARHGAAIAAVMRARTTQTNEPGRCAVLLPALARLPGPLALLEVGASAGLCLLPDRYGYRYGGTLLAPPTADAPVFDCAANAATPVPAALPQVVWRAGLDLNPLDVGSHDDMAWLETLVWPGQDARAERLRAAIAFARRDPPRVIRGDLLTDLESLAAQAPAEATLVVFHTAVLAYVRDGQARQRFADTVARSRAVWICNEWREVFPGWADSAPPAPHPNSFLLAVDGRPVAWTQPHGQAIDWFG
ncbi:MAG: DUF2332 domain-containing protein [Rhodospirillaceae bacterium]|nr:DUF2332 domain-containing protein [Rhodospirillaceae bacterium]